MQEENQDAMRDVDVKPEVGKAQEEPNTASDRVFFTEGELLPWKGRWFRIHLVQGETPHIELEMLKPTGGSTKRAQAEARWLKAHPRSDRAKAVRIAAKLRESLQLLQPALPSAEA